LLGEGGMGAVYKGQDLALGRAVAIKIMHPHIARQEGFRERFLQEARAIALLEHPGIVQIYSFSRSTDMLYIAMSFIAGQSLRVWEQLLSDRQQLMAMPESLALVAKVANALDYAHRRGVVHRDIKPGNIMLRTLAAGETDAFGLTFAPVVTDFGLARLAEGGVMSQTGATMGTPVYMSPEQCEGTAIDGRSDVYSLGIVLYELLTGRIPFNVKTLTEAVRAHTQEPPPPPRSINPAIPSQLEDVVLKAMAKKPEDRFATASAFEEALLELLKGMPAAAVVEDATVVGNVSMSTLVGQAAAAQPDRDQWPTPPSTPVAGGGRVLVMKPNGEVETHPFGTRKQLVIGRDASADIVLNDARVSRKHLQVSLANDKVEVIDLDSTNGTQLEGNRLLPGIPEQWKTSQALRIGDHWLKLELTPESAPVAEGVVPVMTMAEAPVAAAAAPAASGLLITASVEPDMLTVEPGQSAAVTVRIFNQQNQVDHFSVRAEGIPAAWLKTPQLPMRLAPGDVGTITVQIAPPRVASSTAGPINAALVVTSQVNPDKEQRLPLHLRVAPFSNLALALVPSNLTAAAPAHLVVENNGNHPEALQLSGSDPTGTLAIALPAAPLVVAPGTRSSTVMSVKSTVRRPLVGNVTNMPFIVRAQSASERIQSVQGMVTIKPWLPAWALPVLMMLLVALAGGALFVWSAVRTQEAANATATAQVLAQGSAAVLSTAQVSETRTAQVVIEDKTSTAQIVAEIKTSTAMSASEAKTATAQDVSEQKTSDAQSLAQTETKAAVSQTEIAMAGTATVSAEQTATAESPSTTATVSVVKTLVFKPGLFNPIGPVLRYGMASYSTTFTGPDTKVTWTSLPEGVWQMSPQGAHMNYIERACYISSQNLANFSIEATFQYINGWSFGLLLRGNADATTGIKVLYLPSRGAIAVIDIGSGKDLSLIETPIEPGQEYTIHVEVMGNEYTIAPGDSEFSYTVTHDGYKDGQIALVGEMGEFICTRLYIWEAK